jgi:hypothetical protein
MSIAIFDIPVPVVTEIGNAYLLYVKSNGFLEEDEFACVMQKDGSIKHFTSSQIKIWKNATYKIEKLNEQQTSKETKESS